MGVLDLAALGVLVLLVGTGLARGALASGLSLGSLALAYAAALVGGPRLGPAVARALELPGILGTALAGTALGVAAVVVLGVVGWLVRRREQQLRGEEPRSRADRLLGGLFGAIRAGILLVLVGVLANWLDVARTLEAPEAAPRGDSVVGSLARGVVEGAGEAWVGDDDPAGRIAVHTLARPAETFSAVQGLVGDPRVDALTDDRAFWALVEDGRVDAATNRGSFLALAYSDELRARFARVGLVGPDARSDPAAFRDEMAAALREVGPRLRAVRQDPALEELARDPEVVAALEAGDTLALLRHPGVRALVARASEAPVER